MKLSKRKKSQEFTFGQANQIRVEAAKMNDCSSTWSATPAAYAAPMMLQWDMSILAAKSHSVPTNHRLHDNHIDPKFWSHFKLGLLYFPSLPCWLKYSNCSGNLSSGYICTNLYRCRDVLCLHCSYTTGTWEKNYNTVHCHSVHARRMKSHLGSVQFLLI